MTEKDTQIASIPLAILLAHPDNPNQMSKANFNKLINNIERNGFYEPLIVRPHPQRQDHFEIINGHHRKQALEQLGYEKADCIVWDVDDRQVDIFLMTLNRLGGSDTLSKKIALLERLSQKADLKELSKLLPQSKKQIQQLTNLKLSQMPAKQVDNVFALPLVFFVSDEQKQIIEKAMLLVTSDKKTKAARNAEALVKIASEFLEGMAKRD
jgi:ParB/RepB/Spo0J family partition protein